MTEDMVVKVLGVVLGLGFICFMFYVWQWSCQKSWEVRQAYWIEQVMRERRRVQLALDDHVMCNYPDCPKCGLR